MLIASGVSRRFVGGDGRPVPVLTDVSLAVAAGEFVAIVGASGSGKSTLLSLLGGLDTPDAGTIQVDGALLSALDPAARATVRNRTFGFVFQFHHLLRDFTAAENVMMPLLIGGVAPTAARDRAVAALAEVGLSARADFRAPVLSGGEQQRVALARALVTGPRVVLADEPTGNLDAPTAEAMHTLLADRTRDKGIALVVVTHNAALAARADRVLTLDGAGLHPV